MFSVQSDLFDVPVANAAILTDRNGESLQRTFIFENKTASDLSVQIQASADGGTTWTTIVNAFTVGAVGGGSEVVVKNIINTGILRVNASGGDDDRDMCITVLRAFLDANRAWIRPTI